MLQISHLIGKGFIKIAGLAKGRRKVMSPAGVCMCVLVQSVLCHSGDRQIPCFLMSYRA